MNENEAKRTILSRIVEETQKWVDFDRDHITKYLARQVEDIKNNMVTGKYSADEYLAKVERAKAYQDVLDAIDGAYDRHAKALKELKEFEDGLQQA